MIQTNHPSPTLSLDSFALRLAEQCNAQPWQWKHLVHRLATWCYLYPSNVTLLPWQAHVPSTEYGYITPSNEDLEHVYPWWEQPGTYMNTLWCDHKGHCLPKCSHCPKLFDQSENKDYEKYDSQLRSALSLQTHYVILHSQPCRVQ